MRNATREMFGIVIDSVASGRAAVARLLDPRSLYSHVLLNPARDDGLLTIILGLTCDEEGSGTALLLLGRAAGAPSHAFVIPGPGREAIRTALLTGGGAARAATPSVAALRTALADRRIDTRYQPMVRLSDRAPVGFEALARLHRVGHGMIAPEHFVPRIEDAGLAAELTRLIALRSLADLVSPELSRHRFTIGLNVPLDVLLGPDALARMDAARQAAGVAAAQVVVELTESRVVTDLPQLRRVVERFRQTGYGVAIDDISPSMPRYAALLDLPFTAVKIDKDVVLRGVAPRDAADFIERIIAAAKARGLAVVVEGVEDARTWDRMRHAGADMAQGYMIARAMPASVIPAWLEAWRSRAV